LLAEKWVEFGWVFTTVPTTQMVCSSQVSSSALALVANLNWDAILHTTIYTASISAVLVCGDITANDAKEACPLLVLGQFNQPNDRQTEWQLSPRAIAAHSY